MKKAKLGITAVFFLILVFVGTLNSKAEDFEQRENLLIIHSYNQGFSWTDELHRGITENLPASEYNIYTEYLDAYRTDSVSDHKIELIKSYSDKKLSCIVVTDNAAFDLILSLKDEYFKDVPVLFAGVNGGLEDIRYDDVRGILQNVSYKDYLLWLNKAFPDVENLLVCGSKTATTQGTYEQILEAFEESKEENLHYNIQLIEISDYYKQVEMIGEYDPKTTAVYVAGSFGVLNHDQYTDMLSSNSGMPTFCGVSTSIKNEVLGGFVVSPYEHGKLIGTDILSLSAGTNIQSIPIVEEPLQQIVFNYKGMEKFGLKESMLPAGSIIVNKPENRIILTTNQVIMIVVAFCFLVLIISTLIIISEIRKKANRQLLLLNDSLNASRLELEENNIKITYLLEHNQVTQLMNDKRFFEEMSKTYKPDEEIALISIVITNLNSLTLSHGKELFQIILETVSEFLKSITKSGDLLGITYNNEFLIATRGKLDEESDLINKIIKRFEAPLISDLYTVILKYKIGIANYPKMGKSFEQMQDRCDLAITSIYENSLRNTVLYTDTILKELNEENSIRNEIEVALLKREFVMYYQPKYDNDGVSILGFEALIRWKRQDGTIKSPAYFIDVAEQTGQIMKIGLYVMEEVCRAIIEYNLIEKNIPVAINLSGHHFASRDIIHKLQEVVEKYQVPPHFLELEITETTLIKNKAFGAAILKELQDLGFTITLDDFGTGYASIDYIKELPINKIKIDQSFVQKIQDDKAQKLLGVMIQLANDLSLEVTIEGIETQEQFQIVHRFKPTELQGYLFRRPSPLDDILPRNGETDK